MHAIGSYNTAAKYDGDYSGAPSCELFVNDVRMTLARYPNEGFLRSGEVISEGFGMGSMKHPGVYNSEYHNTRNPESDVYAVDDELCDHISSWKTTDDVWMFGYPAYDWADASSPIGYFDAEKKQLSPKFVSYQGAKRGAPYYFYNVFEELDAPGEWYLDRNTGMLYLYPVGSLEGAEIDISLSPETLLTGSNVNYFTLDGLTFKASRGDAIELSGSKNHIVNCTVKNIAGNAITVTGYNNTVSANEITRTGRGGIKVTGGDFETLKPGENLVDNNYIHDYAELYLTYQPAVTLEGVGNICSHNEICDAPHEAISYNGNDHVIEYNDIRRVCKYSTDAGAIYSGLHWDYYGNVIRYNLIADLGTDSYQPNGIYWDDALSGQTAYGNILINIPGSAFMIGGGRDNDVHGNLFVNTTKRYAAAVTYDSRAYDGTHGGGWFTAAQENGTLWGNLWSSSFQTDIWKEAYPQMQKFLLDFSDTDSPDFPANPAYSRVTDNVLLTWTGDERSIGNIVAAVKKYSTVENNPAFDYPEGTLSDTFADFEGGDYTVKENAPFLKEVSDFLDIPYTEIGRYEP